MASQLLRPLLWFYHAFGLDSIHEVGRNAYLIVLARTCRMFAYGTNSLILALFFAELQFSDALIGLFMTLTLFGDVFLGLGLTLVADRVGRRKVLFAGSLLMVFSGITFAVAENFWILLISAIVGVISATGGDFGPFRAIEESILSQLTTPKTRSDVLAWYVTLASWGSALGSEASGRVIHLLQTLDGWTLLDAYHTLFVVYAVMGLVNAGLVLLLSDACEIHSKGETYTQVPQHEPQTDVSLEDDIELIESPGARPRSEFKKPQVGLGVYMRQFSQISSPTRRVMYKLWFLLAIDSVADGMVPYSLTNYYMDFRFHPAKSTLGDVTSVAYFLGAFGGIFAGPLAKKIGLINTMVFTHIPSSAAVLLFPVSGNFAPTVALLFVRSGLNNMDQAPRSAFIAAVVKQEERTSVMGITAMIRTLAATAGPSFTGLLAGSKRFWVAFVIAGACRLIYDVGLYAMFVNMELYKHEQDVSGHDPVSRRGIGISQ